MASAFPCLIDELMLAEAVDGLLETMCEAHRVAVGELTWKSVREACSAAEATGEATVSTLIAHGRLQVMRATAREVADVVRWIGDRTVSGAELEMLAIVMAGRARMYTTDPVVRRMMRDLGIEDRAVGIDQLAEVQHGRG